MKTDTKFNKKQFINKIENYSNEQLLDEGFTIKEKIHLYKFVITVLKENLNEGICVIIWMNINNLAMSQTQYLFPELYSHKPEDKQNGKYWFDTKEERIDVLNKIIKDLKAQL